MSRELGLKKEIQADIVKKVMGLLLSTLELRVSQGKVKEFAY